MNEQNPNSRIDVCRVLATALLSDDRVDDREIEALIEMRVGKVLGISPQQFREVVRDLCKDAMFDSQGHANVSSTDLNAVSEMSSLLGRHDLADAEALKRLIVLVQQESPALFSEQLVDTERLNAVLDRITNPRLQMWVGCVLLRLVSADGSADPKEKQFLQHVFKRWGIDPGTLAC